jgi:hypothetical protein
MCNALQDNSARPDDAWYKVVEDDYELGKWLPDPSFKERASEVMTHLAYKWSENNILNPKEVAKIDLNEALDEYLDLESAIFEYFGYVEGWRRFPIEDSREYFWKIVGGEEHNGCVRYSEERQYLMYENNKEYSEDAIYTIRSLEKWVYRTGNFTMILTHSYMDGNKFLRIFDSNKETEE